MYVVECIVNNICDKSHLLEQISLCNSVRKSVKVVTNRVQTFHLNKPKAEAMENRAVI